MFFNTSKYLREEEKQGEIPKYGYVAKQVLKIAWPAMIECFLVSLVTMFDGIMVSVLGNEANAAVTLTKQPIFLMVSFITALTIALTAIIARRKGENDQEGANKAMHMGIWIAIGISIIISVLVATLSRPICRLMGSEDDTIDLATMYLRINAIGFIFNGLRLTLNGCQRAIGKTKISMISNVLANIINIIFNFLLIGGRWGFPKLGIKGAAVATIFGNFVAFLVTLVALKKKNMFLSLKIKDLFKIKFETFKNIMIVLPSSLFEQIVMRVGFILFAIIVNKMGTSIQYVHGICNDINSMMFTIADGFAIGTAAVVGHRLGEQRKDLAIVYAKVSVTISLMFGIGMCLIMLLSRKGIISLYKPDTSYKRNLAINIMLLAATITIPQNIQWVLTGVLRGSGDTKFTAASSLISVALIRPIIAYLLCYHTSLGLYGAWLGMLIDQCLRAILNMLRFHSRVWLNIEV